MTIIIVIIMRSMNNSYTNNDNNYTNNNNNMNNNIYNNIINIIINNSNIDHNCLYINIHNTMLCKIITLLVMLLIANTVFFISLIEAYTAA